MMRPRTRRRPPSTLPALHSHQLSRRINLHYAIYLPIRMLMILALEFVFAIHVYRRDAEISSLGRWKRNLASFVIGTGDFSLGNPAFCEALFDILAKVFVEGVPGAEFFVQSCF